MRHFVDFLYTVWAIAMVFAVFLLLGIAYIPRHYQPQYDAMWLNPAPAATWKVWK